MIDDKPAMLNSIRSSTYSIVCLFPNGTLGYFDELVCCTKGQALRFVSC